MVARYVETGYWEYGYAQGDALNVSVSVSGVEAVSSFGSIVINANQQGSAGRKRQKRRPIVFIPEEYLQKNKFDVSVSLQPIEITAKVGRVSVFGTISAKTKISSLEISSNFRSVNSRGIINPTDEEIIYLMVA